MIVSVLAWRASPNGSKFSRSVPARKENGGNMFPVGIFLDVARLTARTPHRAHVRRARRNWIDPRPVGIERLTTRTSEQHGVLGDDGDAPTQLLQGHAPRAAARDAASTSINHRPRDAASATIDHAIMNHAIMNGAIMNGAIVNGTAVARDGLRHRDQHGCG